MRPCKSCEVTLFFYAILSHERKKKTFLEITQTARFEINLKDPGFLWNEIIKNLKAWIMQWNLKKTKSENHFVVVSFPTSSQSRKGEYTDALLPNLPNQPPLAAYTPFGQRLNTRQLSWRPLGLQPFIVRLCKALEQENERRTNCLPWTAVCTSCLRPFIQRFVFVLACFPNSKPVFTCFVCVL